MYISVNPTFPDYDILVLTETLLKPNISDADFPYQISILHTEGRRRQTGRWCAHICSRGYPSHQNIESVCIEVTFQSPNILVTGFYRLSNSSQEYWDQIEFSFEI